MKNIKYNFRFRNWRILLFSIAVLSAASCKKFVQVPLPNNQVVTSAVFADSADAVSSVLGMYIQIMGSYGTFNFGNGGITLWTGLSADELYSTTANSDLNEFYTNAVSPVNNGTNNRSIWIFAYNLIYQANACIEGLAGNNGISTPLKNQLTGEATLVRDFYYFNLVNLYGEVPLVTSTDYKANAVLTRIPADSIYNWIVKDLINAQGLLTAAYPSSGQLRPNLYAAKALLAKVYLYQQQWGLAASTASTVISSGLYSLDPALNSVFLINSSEAIWQLSPVISGLETTEGYDFVPSSLTIKPKYVIGNYLLNAFEAGDQRRVNWLDSNVVNNAAYYYPYKYKLGLDGSSTPQEGYMVFRLGEQYLIRAEAEAETGDSSDAISDLNMIRNRAGLENFSAAVQGPLLASIQHERQVELFCEWGNRWYDLKRTGSVNTVLTAEKPGVWPSDGHAALFPIPDAEMLLDVNLTQNMGY